MRTKTSTLAALSLASLITSTAGAAKSPRYTREILCVPTSNYEGVTSIIDLCDARKFNMENDLLVDRYGCALPDQTSKNYRHVFEQTPFEIWGYEEKGIGKRMISCDDDGASLYPMMLEL